MVTIPVYEPNRVQRRALNTTRRTGASPEDFGVNVGQALQRGGRAVEGVAELGQYVADKDAENQARQTSVDLNARVREELWGEQGLMRKEGQAFIDNADATRKRIEDYSRTFGAAGKTAQAQRMIDDVVRREVEPVFNQIDRFKVKAVGDANRATATARVENLIAGAPMVFGDDASMAKMRVDMSGALADEADAYGYDPETRKLKERQAWSRVFVLGIGNALAEDDVETAEKRFEQAVGEGRLTGEAAVEVRSRIADAKNSIAAEQIAVDVATNGGIALDEASVEYKPPLSSMPEPSSTYGPRKHPIDGTVKTHTGIDYPVPEGTPVLASANGVVAEVQNRGGYGLMVRVDHGGGNETWYAHLSEAGVKVGQTVKAGQPIARSGNSGKSTGPHLHYEVRHGGQAIDPSNPAARRVVKPTLENVDQIALAKSGGDPKLFKAYKSALLSRISQDEALKRERRENLLDTAWKYAETATSEAQMPRGVWQALEPKDREAFRGHFKSNLDGGTVTDMSHYGALMTMMSDRPKDFMRYEFETDNQLSTSDKKSLINARTQMRAGQVDEKKRSSLEATNRIANLVMPTSMKDDAKNGFRGVLHRAVAAAEAAQGKPLTEVEIQNMAGRLAVDVTTAQGKAKLFQAGVGGVKPNTVIWSNIPEATRNRLIADYRKAYGRTPTAAQVADQYVMLKSRGLIP